MLPSCRQCLALPIPYPQEICSVYIVPLLLTKNFKNLVPIPKYSKAQSKQIYCDPGIVFHLNRDALISMPPNNIIYQKCQKKTSVRFRSILLPSKPRSSFALAMVGM